jgi:hypothetical protein
MKRCQVVLGGEWTGTHLLQQVGPELHFGHVPRVCAWSEGYLNEEVVVVHSS